VTSPAYPRGCSPKGQGETNVETMKMFMYACMNVRTFVCMYDYRHSTLCLLD
jgi:hypothetical protein